jgi:hypothetical protein
MVMNKTQLLLSCNSPIAKVRIFSHVARLMIQALGRYKMMHNEATKSFWNRQELLF